MKNEFYNFEIPVTKNEENFWEWYEELTGCCAFIVLSDFPKDRDKDLEDTYLIALGDMQKIFRRENKNILFVLSEKAQETMISLVESVPGIELIARVKSTMGNYFLRTYLIAI